MNLGDDNTSPERAQSALTNVSFRRRLHRCQKSAAGRERAGSGCGVVSTLLTAEPFPLVGSSCHCRGGEPNAIKPPGAATVSCTKMAPSRPEPCRPAGEHHGHHSRRVARFRHRRRLVQRRVRESRPRHALLIGADGHHRQDQHGECQVSSSSSPRWRKARPPCCWVRTCPAAARSSAIGHSTMSSATSTPTAP